MRTLGFDWETVAELPVAVSIQRGLTTLRWNTSAVDVEIDGETFPAETGAVVTSLDFSSDGSENNADIIIHARDGGPVEPGDAARGLLDGWPVSVMFFDAADPDSTATEMLPGSIVGSVDEDANGIVTIAASGQLAKAGVVVTEHFALTCRADLGDDHCKVPVLPADIDRGVAYVRPDTTTGALTQGEFAGVNLRDLAMGITGWTRGELTMVDIGLQHVNDAYGRMLTGSPASYANVYYECTVAGTTHATVAPTYDPTPGNTTVDGTATFIARNAWIRQVTGEAVNGSAGGTYEVQLDFLPDPRATDPTWFVLGYLYPRSGALANLPKIPIRAWDPDTLTVTLFLPVALTDMPAGTELEISAGCNLTKEQCHTRFDNITNRRAEDFVPPPDIRF